MKIITVEKILLEFDPEKSKLLLALKKINSHFGYISEKDAQKVAEYFMLPLSQVYETASFYDLIETRKTALLKIQICSGGDCVLSGGNSILHEVENYFKIKAGDEFNPKVQVEKISCLGRCADGPIMIVNGKVYERVTTSKVYTILAEYI